MQYIQPIGPQGPANAYGNDYVDKNAGAGIAGSFLAADMPEHVQIEILNVIAKSGWAPSAADLLQMTKAIRSQRLNYVPTVGGTANALTITLDPAPAALADLTGARFLIIPSATNTAAATININGLGAVAIQRLNGAALQAGDLVSGAPVLAAVHGGVLKLLSQPNMGVTGNVATPGWTRFPNGLIMQWGTFASSSSAFVTVTFPIAFPTACFGVQASDITSPLTITQGSVAVMGVATLTNFQIGSTQNFTSAVSDGGQWFAIGN